MNLFDFVDKHCRDFVICIYINTAILDVMEDIFSKVFTYVPHDHEFSLTFTIGERYSIRLYSDIDFFNIRLEKSSASELMYDLICDAAMPHFVYIVDLDSEKIIPFIDYVLNDLHEKVSNENTKVILTMGTYHNCCDRVSITIKELQHIYKQLEELDPLVKQVLKTLIREFKACVDVLNFIKLFTGVYKSVNVDERDELFSIVEKQVVKTTVKNEVTYFNITTEFVDNVKKEFDMMEMVFLNIEEDHMNVKTLGRILLDSKSLGEKTMSIHVYPRYNVDSEILNDVISKNFQIIKKSLFKLWKTYTITNTLIQH